MTITKRLKDALEALGLNKDEIAKIAHGEAVVEIIDLQKKAKEFAIAFCHSNIDGTIEDYELFMNGKEDFTPWQPFEYFDKDSRIELISNIKDSLENWYKPKIKKAGPKHKEKIKTEVATEYVQHAEEVEIEAEIEYVQHITISNIKWDADDMEDVKDLPTEVEAMIPLEMLLQKAEFLEEVDDVAEEWISEYITNKYEFTHDGFSHSFNKNSYFENSFQDYMNKDKKWIPEGTLIGHVVNRDLKLLDGIFFADMPRNKYLNFEHDCNIA